MIAGKYFCFCSGVPRRVIWTADMSVCTNTDEVKPPKVERPSSSAHTIDASRPMKVPVQKSGDRCDGPMRLSKFRTEHLEDMDHAVPDLQTNIDPGGARLVGEHNGIIQHGFAVADLDQ